MPISFERQKTSHFVLKTQSIKYIIVGLKTKLYNKTLNSMCFPVTSVIIPIIPLIAPPTFEPTTTVEESTPPTTISTTTITTTTIKLCDEPMGASSDGDMPDTFLDASSFAGVAYAPEKGRLNGPGAWRPDPDDDKPFLEVSFKVIWITRFTFFFF